MDNFNTDFSSTEQEKDKLQSTLDDIKALKAKGQNVVLQEYKAK